MTVALIEVQPIVPPITGYEFAPDGTYWVYTESGAATHGKRPGEVIAGNPYRAYSYWINAGDVRPEPLE